MWEFEGGLISRLFQFEQQLQVNKLAKLIVLPSALKDTEGFRRRRRNMKAMKGIKGIEAY